MSGGFDAFKNWLVIFLVVLLLSGGCSTPEVKLDASASGSQKELALGQALVVALESNPSTGYRWEVAEIDQTVLRQSGTPVFQSTDPRNPPPPGADGTETVRFEVVGTGTTNLKMIYHRPWETGAQPLKVFTVQVAVR